MNNVTRGNPYKLSANNCRINVRQRYYFAQRVASVCRRLLLILVVCQLGNMLTVDGKPDEEIKRGIGFAKAAYLKIERVLSSKGLALATRKRLLKCYTWSKLLYCCESWTISKTIKTRLQAAEMWLACQSVMEDWRSNGCFSWHLPPLWPQPQEPCHSGLTSCLVVFPPTTISSSHVCSFGRLSWATFLRSCPINSHFWIALGVHTR